MVDFGAVAAAYADDVREHGGEIRTGAGVRALVEREDHVEAVGAGVIARHAVACAGAWSDRLALASGARPDVRIVPFRGSYLRLLRPDLVRGQIYPVPDPALPFLGVHLSRTIQGEVLIGPTALLAPGPRRPACDPALARHRPRHAPLVADRRPRARPRRQPAPARP